MLEAAVVSFLEEYIYPDAASKGDHFGCGKKVIGGARFSPKQLREVKREKKDRFCGGISGKGH